MKPVLVSLGRGVCRIWAGDNYVDVNDKRSAKKLFKITYWAYTVYEHVYRRERYDKVPAVEPEFKQRLNQLSPNEQELLKVFFRSSVWYKTFGKIFLGMLSDRSLSDRLFYPDEFEASLYASEDDKDKREKREVKWYGPEHDRADFEGWCTRVLQLYFTEYAPPHRKNGLNDSEAHQMKMRVLPTLYKDGFSEEEAAKSIEKHL